MLRIEGLWVCVCCFFSPSFSAPRLRMVGPDKNTSARWRTTGCRCTCERVGREFGRNATNDINNTFTINTSQRGSRRRRLTQAAAREAVGEYQCFWRVQLAHRVRLQRASESASTVAGCGPGPPCNTVGPPRPGGFPTGGLNGK